MAWHRPGDKPLLEPMMVSILMYTCICITLPQWVNRLLSAITWTNFDPDICLHMVSLGHNESIFYAANLGNEYGVCWCLLSLCCLVICSRNIDQFLEDGIMLSTCIIQYVRSVQDLKSCNIYSCISKNSACRGLTHWGRVTHIWVSELTIIGSDNGLLPGRHEAIIWTNDGKLLIGPLGTNSREILIKIYTFSFRKMLSAKWPFCLDLNVSCKIYSCFSKNSGCKGLWQHMVLV